MTLRSALCRLLPAVCLLLMPGCSGCLAKIPGWPGASSTSSGATNVAPLPPVAPVTGPPTGVPSPAPVPPVGAGTSPAPTAANPPAAGPAWQSQLVAVLIVMERANATAVADRPDQAATYQEWIAASQLAQNAIDAGKQTEALAAIAQGLIPTIRLIQAAQRLAPAAKPQSSIEIEGTKDGAHLVARDAVPSASYASAGPEFLLRPIKAYSPAPAPPSPVEQFNDAVAADAAEKERLRKAGFPFGGPRPAKEISRPAGLPSEK